MTDEADRDPQRDSRSKPRPLEVGRKVRDLGEDAIGTVLDHACQYAHPKAPPVYSYLIRWQDGQVTALSEIAFNGQGYEVLD